MSDEKKPCEKCGHCPACGRGGYYVQPYWRWIPPVGDAPTYPYRWTTITSTSTGTA